MPTPTPDHMTPDAVEPQEPANLDQPTTIPIDDQPIDERHDGLVYCCDTLGWVTPAEAFDHRWDAYSGTD